MHPLFCSFSNFSSILRQIFWMEYESSLVKKIRFLFHFFFFFFFYWTARYFPPLTQKIFRPRSFSREPRSWRYSYGFTFGAFVRRLKKESRANPDATIQTFSLFTSRLLRRTVTFSFLPSVFLSVLRDRAYSRFFSSRWVSLPVLRVLRSLANTHDDCRWQLRTNYERTCDRICSAVKFVARAGLSRKFTRRGSLENDRFDSFWCIQRDPVAGQLTTVTFVSQRFSLRACDAKRPGKPSAQCFSSSLLGTHGPY